MNMNYKRLILIEMGLKYILTILAKICDIH